MKYNLPILELESIAYQAPQHIKEQINTWIDKYIDEAHYEIKEYKPFDEGHSKYNIENAMVKLGAHLAEKSNMYATFDTKKTERRMRISMLYFKGEK